MRLNSVENINGTYEPSEYEHHSFHPLSHDRLCTSYRKAPHLRTFLFYLLDITVLHIGWKIVK